jgi:HemY protein
MAIARLVLALLVVAALSLAVTWVANLPGGVDVEVPGWRIELSLIGAALLGGVPLLVLLWLSRQWGKFRNWAGYSARRRAARRQETALAHLTRGFLAAAAGDAPAAAAAGQDAGRLLAGSPLVNLLTAQVAQMTNDRPGAEQALRALADHPDGALAGIRGLLTLARADHDRAEMTKLVHRAVELKPDAAWAVASLYEIEVADGDYAEAENTLLRLLRLGGIEAQEARRQQAHLLLARAKAAGASDIAAALKHAKAALKLMPDFAPAAAYGVWARSQLGQPRRSWWALEKAWKLGPHPELAASFRRIFAEASAPDRLSRAQTLANAHPNHPESRLLLAEAALAADNLKLAREMLEAIEPKGARAFQLLGALDQKQYGDGAAWLAKAAAAKADPDLANADLAEAGWYCRQCRAEADEWQAKCPACGSFASLDWDRPRRAPAAQAQSLASSLSAPSLSALTPLSPAPASSERALSLPGA